VPRITAGRREPVRRALLTDMTWWIVESSA
jgi:hypothetical protein